MSLWNLLSLKAKNEQAQSLFEAIEASFPQYSKESLLNVTCIAGLLASVAYNDLVVTTQEEDAIKTALKDWIHLPKEQMDLLSKVAIEYSKKLGQLENHIYTQRLDQQLSKDEKYHLLESLFYIAASDGQTSDDESTQIKNISKSLSLGQEYFLAARAKVKESLSLLK